MVRPRLGLPVVLILLLAVFALPVLAAQTPAPASATVTAYRLNVRDLPDVNTGQVVAVLSQGQTVPVIGWVGDYSWWQIETNGIYGWVNARYVRVDAHNLVPPTPTVTPVVPTPVTTPQLCRGTLYFQTTDEHICPLGAASDTQMAYQSFERGFMLWEGSTGAVYVFPSGGRVSVIPVSAYGRFPDPELETPPLPNLVQPINAFGKVWGNLGWVREQLGWANQPETGYAGKIQEGQFRPTGLPLTFLMLQNGSVIAVGPRTGVWFTVS